MTNPLLTELSPQSLKRFSVALDSLCCYLAAENYNYLLFSRMKNIIRFHKKSKCEDRRIIVLLHRPILYSLVGALHVSFSLKAR